MKELIKKLSQAKKEIGKISKDNTNPFFKSNYFDINSLLNQVEPILEKYGLMVLQPILSNKVITEIYDIDTGECISSEMELPKEMNPQKIGSAITYYRRYTLQSLLSLQAEDDDGNKASQQETKPLPILSKEKYNDAVTSLKNGITIKQMRNKYQISNELEIELKNKANETV